MGQTVYDDGQRRTDYSLTEHVEDPVGTEYVLPEHARTVPAGGRTRIELCRRRGRIVARLPDLRPGERLAAFTASGDYVAWRTWRSGRPGSLVVARIVRGRPRAVRRVAIPVLSSRKRHERRLAVAPDGTLVTVRRTSAGTHVLVWHRDRRRPSSVALVRRGPVIAVAPGDGQHVVVHRQGGDATLVRHRPPTPGRCPRAYGVHEATDVFGLELRSAASLTFEGGEAADFVWVEWVCDRTDGRTYLRRTESFSGSRYDYDPLYTVTTARGRAGSVLLEELGDIVYDSKPSAWRGRFVDVRTGAGESFRGAIDAPGAPPKEPHAVDRRTGRAANPVAIGLILRPGLRAWVRSGDPARGTPVSVMLADAGGTREVGTTRPLPPDVYSPDQTRLRLDGDALRWVDAAGEERAVPVVPVADGGPFGYRARG